PSMDEVDRLPVDLGAEGVELVEPRLVHAPVVVVTPMVGELPQVVDRDPVLPAGPLDLVGEAGAREPVVQVLEDRVIDPNLERPDLLAHGMVAGSVSQPRTVDVGASAACSRSTSHSGKRCRTSSSAMRPSRRAKAAPRQK